MEHWLSKEDLLYSGEGFALYATRNDELAIIEWEQVDACHLAQLLDRTLRSHALGSTFKESVTEREMLVQRVEPTALHMRARAGEEGASAEFVDHSGKVWPLDAAPELDGMKPTRLTYMEDIALHAMRSLRAHFGPLGFDGIELTLRFGVAANGDCLLQVINPVECQLGTTDYAALCAQWGGETT